MKRLTYKDKNKAVGRIPINHWLRTSKSMLIWRRKKKYVLMNCCCKIYQPITLLKVCLDSECVFVSQRERERDEKAISERVCQGTFLVYPRKLSE